MQLEPFRVEADALDFTPSEMVLTVDLKLRNTWRAALGYRLLGWACRLLRAEVEILADAG